MFLRIDAINCDKMQKPKENVVIAQKNKDLVVDQFFNYLTQVREMSFKISHIDGGGRVSEGIMYWVKNPETSQYVALFGKPNQKRLMISSVQDKVMLFVTCPDPRDKFRPYEISKHSMAFIFQKNIRWSQSQNISYDLAGPAKGNRYNLIVYRRENPDERAEFEFTIEPNNVIKLEKWHIQSQIQKRASTGLRYKELQHMIVDFHTPYHLSALQKNRLLDHAAHVGLEDILALNLQAK